MKLQNARGVRDIPPPLKIRRQAIIDVLRGVFESYGFNPLETPIIERFDILSAKYGGGEEILKETFKLTDQGKRELGLRFDLTVPLSRFVGMNPNLKMPFKRYQIGRVFRDGPIKLGRYREFWQCDVDIIGCKGMEAEAELLTIATDVFLKLSMPAVIKVNNRKLLNGILTDAGMTENHDAAILSLDKLAKIGKDGVAKELSGKGFSEETIQKILGYFEQDLSWFAKNISDDEGKEGVAELQALFKLLGRNDAVVFDPSLSRGLSYYTGTVFEAFLKDAKITSAVAGGGRYDRMISDYLDAKKAYPAVGISFGLEVITDSAEADNAKKTVSQLFIIPVGKDFYDASLKVAKELRRQGINVEIDLMRRGLMKNLNYA
ncbi:MAG: histidine--tRNA ligase, partial [DPANN group archaeon]|nr:histidine--tRNA ligase [DPANN group archaeon]